MSRTTSLSNPAATAAAAALLRLGLGAVALAHGLLKVFVYTMPGTVAFFVAHGYPAALAWLVTAAELAGGLGLLAGVAARWASSGLVPVFAGAALTVAPNGWIFDSPGGGGWEFGAFLALAAAASALLGPGALALGPALARRLGARPAPPRAEGDR